MSFSHLEKSLILLRDSGQWSRDVAAVVQALYDRHDRQEPNESPEPQRDMRNFVFLADFAPGYTNTAVLVSYFKLSELEYCLLHDLGGLGSSTTPVPRRAAQTMTTARSTVSAPRRAAQTLSTAPKAWILQRPAA
jgi:hypothetical protein